MRLRQDTWLRLAWFLLPGCVNGWSFGDANLGAPPVLEFKAEVCVCGQGVFLPEIANLRSGASLPALRIGDAPALGQATILSREQLREQLQKAAPELANATWSGAERVRVTRRSRLLDEAQLTALLTAALQREIVRERGELELRLARAWTPLTVPDDPLTLKLEELPPGGLAANTVLRFGLLANNEPVGSWQTVVRAKIFREVMVARTALRRGQAVAADDFALERRDILQARETLLELPAGAGALEMAESLPPGAALSARALQLRPVIRRGEVVAAVLCDGAMTISLKVEALDNGAPGQSVRVRNLTTRKEFRGKVRDEQTVVVSL